MYFCLYFQDQIFYKDFQRLKLMILLIILVFRLRFLKDKDKLSLIFRRNDN